MESPILLRVSLFGPFKSNYPCFALATWGWGFFLKMAKLPEPTSLEREALRDKAGSRLIVLFAMLGFETYFNNFEDGETDFRCVSANLQ